MVLMNTLRLAAGFALALGSAAAADASGVWKVTGDVAGNAVNPTCTFKQEEKKISGDCKGESGDAAQITGEVDGDKVTWTWVVQGYTLVFTGTLDGGSGMKGTFDVENTQGTFSAKKQ